MLHAIALAARATTHSQLLASTSDFDTIFLCMFPSFGQKDFPIGVLPKTQYLVGCSESHFSVNSTALVATAFEFFSSSISDLRTSLFQGPATELRNQIVARPVPQGSDVYNPPAKRWAVTLWRQIRSRSARCINSLQASSYRQYRQTSNNTQHKQVQSQVMKCTRTLGCQPAIPKRQVFTTTTIQLIHQYIPCSDTII